MMHSLRTALRSSLVATGIVVLALLALSFLLFTDSPWLVPVIFAEMVPAYFAIRALLKKLQASNKPGRASTALLICAVMLGFTLLIVATVIGLLRLF